MNDLIEVEGRFLPRKLCDIESKLLQAQSVTVNSIIEQGALLHHAKDMIPHGQKTEWLEKMGYSSSTAKKFIKTYLKFGLKGSAPNHLNQSQLFELLPDYVTDDTIQTVIDNPDMTQKEVRVLAAADRDEKWCDGELNEDDSKGAPAHHLDDGAIEGEFTEVPDEPESSEYELSQEQDGIVPVEQKEEMVTMTRKEFEAMFEVKPASIDLTVVSTDELKAELNRREPAPEGSVIGKLEQAIVTEKLKESMSSLPLVELVSQSFNEADEDSTPERQRLKEEAAEELAEIRRNLGIKTPVNIE